MERCKKNVLVAKRGGKSVVKQQNLSSLFQLSGKGWGAWRFGLQTCLQIVVDFLNFTSKL